MITNLKFLGPGYGRAVLLAVTMAVCLTVLLLPTDCDPSQESYLPHFLCMAVHQKIAAAYVLGN